MNLAEKNTMSILEAVGYSPTSAAKMSAESLCSLPSLTSWDVGTPQPAHANRMLQWGNPFRYIPKGHLTNAFFDRIGIAIKKSGIPRPPDHSEVSALGLFAAHRAVEFDPMRQANQKIHDFSVSWDGQWIEVEVTRPDQKRDFLLRSDAASALSVQLKELEKPFDVVVYAINILDSQLVGDVARKASSKQANEREESCGKWLLFTEVGIRDVRQIVPSAGDDRKPDWWPKDQATGCCASGKLAGPESTSAPPQAAVYYAIPLLGYLNSTVQKARDFQGSRSRPFLLAVDVSNLPKAFDAFRSAAQGFFEKRRHVSGVLFFRSDLPFGEGGWNWELFSNSIAYRPLPIGMLAAMPVCGKVMKTFAFFDELQHARWQEKSAKEN